MSRAQQGQVFQQAKGESQGAFGSAENAYNLAQQDVGNYQGQLSKYAASNPFLPGGEYQTSQNQVLADTADAAARGIGGRLQMQAARTGQNPAGSIAATEEMERQAARDLSAEQAKANESRIGQEAEYNRSVLGATAVPVGMETSIGTGQGELYGHGLRSEEEAAKTPSLWDTLGSSFAQSLGEGIGIYAAPTKG